MTSSSEQPPKEYTFVCDCCQNKCKVTSNNAIPPDCGCLINSDIGAMWNPRPHPTPAPCPQHQIWQHCPVAGEIARKAREDVLDKVIAWKRKHGYWFTINGISGEKRYHFEPDRFEEFIKEIRHNAPHTEQEQPR